MADKEIIQLPKDVKSTILVHEVQYTDSSLTENYWGYVSLLRSKPSSNRQSLRIDSYARDIERLLGHSFAYSQYARIMGVTNREQRCKLMKELPEMEKRLAQELPLIYNDTPTDIDWVLECRQNIAKLNAAIAENTVWSIVHGQWLDVVNHPDLSELFSYYFSRIQTPITQDLITSEMNAMDELYEEGYYEDVPEGEELHDYWNNVRGLLEEQLSYIVIDEDVKGCQSWYLQHVLYIGDTIEENNSVNYGGVFVFYDHKKTFHSKLYITYQGIARHPVPYVINRYLPNYEIKLPSLNAALQPAINSFGQELGVEYLLVMPLKIQRTILMAKYEYKEAEKEESKKWNKYYRSCPQIVETVKFKPLLYRQLASKVMSFAI